jgi:hypothetical protein
MNSAPLFSIRTITVGDPITVPGNCGDTWALAWTPEGNLYSPANDTKGFQAAIRGSNICFNEIRGDSPAALTGETINLMSDYRYHGEEGAADGCMWKSSGCASIDGVLYLAVSRHMYGEKTGDATRRQTAQNTSLIQSHDGGKTWLRAARENHDHPMFPGQRFATPYFVNYGQDGHESFAHGSDRYVYAHSNNGFWDNGDDMILGRIERSNLVQLRGEDWSYFCGGDGLDDASWSADRTKAKPVLSNASRLGATGAVFLPQCGMYLLVGWYYPLGGGKMPGASSETIWDFYTSPFPWGPWTQLGSHRFSPQGYYCPVACPKFTSEDGSVVWVSTAGDWNNPEVYRLTFVPLKIN